MKIKEVVPIVQITNNDGVTYGVYKVAIDGSNCAKEQIFIRNGDFIGLVSFFWKNVSDCIYEVTDDYAKDFLQVLEECAKPEPEEISNNKTMLNWLYGLLGDFCYLTPQILEQIEEKIRTKIKELENE